MGLFSKRSRTLTDDTQQGNLDDQEKKKKGGLLAALVGSDKYRKTPEQKEEERLTRTLEVRLRGLKLKKYKDNRPPRYNHKKHRFEVGADFDLRTLPNLIYSTAKRSSILRSKIGGRFDLGDRDFLKNIIRHHRYKVQKMQQKLNRHNEKNCVVSIDELF